MLDTSEVKTSAETKWETLLVRFTPWLVALQVEGATCAVLISKHSWMEYPADDYFYYLKVAQNLASGHGSTFNGIVATNGYHPLWLLILTAFNFFTKNGAANLAFIGVAALLATVACFVWTRAIFVLSGIDDDLVATGLALWTSVFCCRKFYLGMEIVLTLPLAFLLILLVLKRKILESKKSSFSLGLVCSLLILSRLDSGFLVALLGVGVLLNSDFRRQLTPARVLSFLAGLIPFFTYLAWNKLAFRLWLPVSGEAKDLKPHYLFSPSTWTSILLQGNFKEHLHTRFILITAVVIVAGYRMLTSRQRIVFPAVMLFPVVYYTALSFLSDWRSVSEWYIYATRPALCIALAFWFSRNSVKNLMTQAAFRYAVLAIGLYALATNFWGYPHNTLYQEGESIRNFAANHPGIYAMGDRSGKTGFLLPAPLVQLEGLVMDHSYLDELKTHQDLRAVLNDYHVRYYIADVHSGYTGCFNAVEPWEAGPSSRVLHGTFCETPVWSFPSSHDELVIFDLAPAVTAHSIN